MKRNAEEIRGLIKKRLEYGDIVLWGYNEAAKAFYLNNRDKYRMKACVTEQRNHPNYLLEESLEMPIAEWNEYKAGENDYIIMFGTPFIHIENQISASGLKIFEDYVDANLVEYLLSGKKIAIVAGSCQIVAFCDILREVKSFTDEYVVLRFPTHNWKSRYALKSISYLKNICDLYLCMKHEDDDLMFFSKEELPEGCRVVTLPYAVMRLYWPQIKGNWRNMGNEFFLKSTETKQHGPFEIGDMNINRMIKEGKDVEEIVETLTSEDFYTDQQIKDHIDMALRTLEFAEEGCDIRILPYIRENFTQKMLYRDMTHMQPALICEMVRQVLRYLGMDASEIDDMQRRGVEIPIYKEFSEHCTEIPIYPSVAKHMGMEWAEKNALWDVRFYNGLRKLTFEEYVRAYYGLCSKMAAVLAEW